MTIDEFIKAKVRTKFKIKDNVKVELLIFSVPGDDVQIQISWTTISGFKSIRYYNGWSQFVNDMENPV